MAILQCFFVMVFGAYHVNLADASDKRYKVSRLAKPWLCQPAMLDILQNVQDTLIIIIMVLFVL